MTEYVKVYRSDPYVGTEPGIYENASCWYVRDTNGAVCLLVGMNVVKVDDTPPAPAATGVSEATLLKAIAVAQDPELARELTHA